MDLVHLQEENQNLRALLKHTLKRPTALKQAMARTNIMRRIGFRFDESAGQFQLPIDDGHIITISLEDINKLGSEVFISRLLAWVNIKKKKVTIEVAK